MFYQVQADHTIKHGPKLLFFFSALMGSVVFKITDEIASQKTVVVPHFSAGDSFRLHELVQGLPADTQKMTSVFRGERLVAVSILK